MLDECDKIREKIIKLITKYVTSNEDCVKCSTIENPTYDFNPIELFKNESEEVSLRYSINGVLYDDPISYYSIDELLWIIRCIE